MGGLLTGIILLAFWIRIQGVSQLPVNQFTETDAYLYHWQAKIISKHGQLPERDMHRWSPVGRDNTQLLSLYAYAIAYLHKAFQWLSLYQIQLYLPVFAFIVGLGALFLFLTHTQPSPAVLNVVPQGLVTEMPGAGCSALSLSQVTSGKSKYDIPFLKMEERKLKIGTSISQLHSLGSLLS